MKTGVHRGEAGMIETNDSTALDRCNLGATRPHGGIQANLTHSANSPSIRMIRADTSFNSASITSSGRGGSNT